MSNEFKDGICVVTKKKSQGCLVAPAGTIYEKREALFSEEGINQLDEMYKNASEYFHENCIINQKRYKKCLKVFNMFFLKRNAFISSQGIDNLANSIAEKPTLTEGELDDLVSDIDVEVPVEDPVVEEPDIDGPPAPPAPEPPEDVIEEDLQLQAIIHDRETASMEVAELQENLNNAEEEEIKNELIPLLKEAQEKLMQAELAERDYINKD